MPGNKNVVEVLHGHGEGVEARQEVGQSQEVKEGQELGQRQEVEEGQEAGQRQEVKEGQEAGQSKEVKEGQEVEGLQVAADKEDRGTLLSDFPILFDLVRPALEEIPELPPAPAPSPASFPLTHSPSHLPLVSRPFPCAPGQEVGEGQDVRKGQEEWQEDRMEEKECDEEVAKVFKQDSSASCPSPTATAPCPGTVRHDEGTHSRPSLPGENRFPGEEIGGSVWVGYLRLFSTPKSSVPSANLYHTSII